MISSSFGKAVRVEGQSIPQPGNSITKVAFRHGELQVCWSYPRNVLPVENTLLKKLCAGQRKARTSEKSGGAREPNFEVGGWLKADSLAVNNRLVDSATGRP